MGPAESVAKLAQMKTWFPVLLPSVDHDSGNGTVEKQSQKCKQKNELRRNVGREKLMSEIPAITGA